MTDTIKINPGGISSRMWSDLDVPDYFMIGPSSRAPLIFAEGGTPYVREDIVLAHIAAAFRAAALYLNRQSTTYPDDVAYCVEDDAKAILALTPIDARAALERMLDAARREEREACALIADDHTPDRPLASHTTAMVIAAAIRARKGDAT